MAEKHIYILRLEEGKYYIGKSENPIKRYEAHLAGTGSSWTKKYPPIELINVIENSSAFDEDKYTKEYMATYGIDNVRGGSYVTQF
jgi:predicted GIY-YIG superfamily endonuclease